MTRVVNLLTVAGWIAILESMPRDAVVVVEGEKEGWDTPGLDLATIYPMENEHFHAGFADETEVEPWIKEPSIRPVALSAVCITRSGIIKYPAGQPRGSESNPGATS